MVKGRTVMDTRGAATVVFASVHTDTGLTLWCFSLGISNGGVMFMKAAPPQRASSLRDESRQSEDER